MNDNMINLSTSESDDSTGEEDIPNTTGRARSRSRVDSRSRESSPRQRLQSRRSRHPSQRSRRRRGRRQREMHHSESWYFPEERTEDSNPIESHEDIVAANNAWVETLDNNPSQAIGPVNTHLIRGLVQTPVSPLAQGNRHGMLWRENSRTVTLTAARDGRRNANISNRGPRATTPDVENIPPAARAETRVPNGSHPDVNFNLARRLQERSRALQQLDQAASHIQVAAAAAAASYAQLVAAQQSYDNNSQQHTGVQSRSAWANRVEHEDSRLNTSFSETHQLAAAEHWHAVRRPQQVRAGSHVQFGPISSLHIRSAEENQRVTRSEDEEAVSRASLLVNRNSNLSTEMPNSSEDILQQSYHQLTNRSESYNQPADESDQDPYHRYDAAFRRQETRNAWRQRRRLRRDRQERQEMAERIEQRRRARTNNSITNLVRYDTNPILPPNNAVPLQLPPALAPTLLPEPAIPIPPPLPPQGWQSPPRLDNEWPGAPNHIAITPGVLQTPPQSPRSQEQCPLLENDSDDDADNEEDISDYTEMTEYMLKSYQDPGESNSRLGDYLRRITSRGRVIISRVKTRVTKQYFRRGDFQIALADFRSLHPEHARQVTGVGFTGTINNMYRLTVKQNSTYGKPTFEIRPMNRKVRRKKVHVCYKIRYLGSRRARGTRTRSHIPLPV